MKEKPKIIVLLGYPRSGSTVFGELINSFDEFIHVGEMERLWYPRKNEASLFPQKGCSCGKKLFECEFWAPHLKKVAQKILTINKEEDIEINSKVLCGYKEDYIQKGKIYGKEAEIYAKIIETLYSSLYHEEKKIIFDSSKELWYAKYLESTDLFDLSYVHLIRDVKGIVYSRQKKLRKFNENSGKINLNYKYLIYDTIRWNWTNKQITQFLKGKKNIKVSYEDLVKDPHSVLTAFGEMCQIRIYPKEAINSNNEFEIIENHLVHGNRFRFKRGKIKLNKDNRWLNEMKLFDKKIIDRLSWFKMSPS